MPEPNGQPPRPTPNARAGQVRSSILDRIESTFRRAVDRPSPAQQVWHVAQMVVMGARKAQIPRMAAALSYRTIFGLIPVLVVGFVVLAAFASHEAVSDKVHKLLEFAGLKAIEVHPPARTEADYFGAASGGASVPAAPPANEAPAAPARGAPTAAGTEADFFEQAMDETGLFSASGAPPADGTPAGIDVWIEGLVDRVRKLPSTALTTVGIATLIYAAISMLVEIEQTFNQIYMAPRGRSWVRRVVQYWALLTLGTIGLVGTFTATEYFTSFVESLSLGFLTGAKIALLKSMQFVVPAIVTTGLLVFAYMTVPNTRVRLVPAIAGAFLAALMWEVAKQGFRWYVVHSVSYSNLYGPIALLPLFLLWVYVTWIIVLTGLQFAHALQTYGTAKQAGLTRSVLATLGLIAEAGDPARPLVVDPAASLVVMATAAERFRAGKPTDHASVADKTGIDERVVSELLERLARAGMLHRITGGDDEGAYTLSRPPESIAAADALRVGDEITAIDRERAPRLLGELEEARVKALGGKTLAEMIGSLDR